MIAALEEFDQSSFTSLKIKSRRVDFKEDIDISKKLTGLSLNLAKSRRIAVAGEK